ncbi:Rossmann-fold NAD(P)-binding domain-containing protein [Flindersiella endophytica]
MSETWEIAVNVELAGKNALVIGGSRGVGRATVERLAASGASVAFSYVTNKDAASAVVEEVQSAGGKAIAVQADLARLEEIHHMFDEAESELGQLDIVVANAGVAVIKPVVDCTEADYDHIFGVNAKGTFFALREAARRVRDGGRIIAVSTGGTKMLFTGTSLYLGSKGAVEQFVRTLSQELGPRGVTVNALSPGFTDTDLLPERDRAVAAEMSPFKRIGDPLDVADAAVFLASDAARWVTGQNLGAGGGVF